MNKIFIYIVVPILIISCETTFEREFQRINPLELGKALSNIDTLDNCKKEWVSKRIIEYHSQLLNLKKNKEKNSIGSSDYYQKTLEKIFLDYSTRYDESIKKWQNIYDDNTRIKKLIQIDTAYVIHNKSGDLYFITEFKPNQETEEASFSIKYTFWYNYENSVTPDKEITAYADYNLAGHVFKDTIRIRNIARSGIFEDFSTRFKSIGTNGVIKGKKSDEFSIDYLNSKVILTNGQKLDYKSLNSMPTDICIVLNPEKTMPNKSYK